MLALASGKSVRDEIIHDFKEQKVMGNIRPGFFLMVRLTGEDGKKYAPPFYFASG